MSQSAMSPSSPGDVTIRTERKPGDLGDLVSLHGRLYAQEFGFDQSFEAYVAGLLSKFGLSTSAQEQLWIAERDDHIVGCIAIVACDPDVAQLRWYLVDPSARGMGLGRRLLNEAVAFSRSAGYQSIILWTVSALTAAAQLYRSVGFRRVEQIPATRWGVSVIDEKYELIFS